MHLLNDRDNARLTENGSFPPHFAFSGGKPDSIESIACVHKGKPIHPEARHG